MVFFAHVKIYKYTLEAFIQQCGHLVKTRTIDPLDCFYMIVVDLGFLCASKNVHLA